MQTKLSLAHFSKSWKMLSIGMGTSLGSPHGLEGGIYVRMLGVGVNS